VKRAIVAFAATALLVGGCSEADTEASHDHGGRDSARPSTAVTTSPSEPSASPEVVSAPIEVAFADGKVTPVGRKVKVRVGDDVVFSVTSDTSDEMHIHGEPEKTLEVTESADVQTFVYTPTVPGQIAVESHHLDTTIVTLVVEP
jgi:hypothetical protein